MQPEEMIGQKLGHYRIMRSLGYGGSATVFLAEDIHLQRNVAIKVFRPSSTNPQEFLRRFAREARVLAQLDHPNILPVYEYGEEGTTAYLVMQYMAGGSLRDWLRDRGPVPARETVQLMSQMLSALQYAHERNLVHRDIKPGNMLFKADGTLMLSDFGLVKILADGEGKSMPLDETSTNTTAHTVTGTPHYMAPEQINHKVVPASDIYAIGVVLYEMLTGAHIFKGESYISLLLKHLYEQPRLLHDINPHISPELEAIVQRALHKDPAQRYQRPAALRQALLQAVGEDVTVIDNKTNILIKNVSNSTSSNQLLSQRRENTTLAPPTYPQALSSTSLESSATLPETEVSIPPAPLSPSQALPNPPLPNISQPSIGASQPHSNKPLIIALLLTILVLTSSLGVVIYSQGTFKNFIPSQVSRETPISQGKPPINTVTPIGNKGGIPFNTGAGGNTEKVPPTLLDCPTTDQARAAITARFVLGSKQNIIYIVNEGTAAHPTFGTIKRLEADPNADGVEISKMAQTSIGEAQVSQDGQWVLFVANTGGRSQLRMVRVDGDGLQTLYCSPINTTISHSQWSFDQRTVIFNRDSGTGTPITYLLDIFTGNLQVELVPQSTQSYTPRTWLDNTHVYMTASSLNTTNASQKLYLLDVTKGANQHDGDLHKIIPDTQMCGSFDSSYDSRQLLISTCEIAAPVGNGPNSFVGPAIITSEPTNGGNTQAIRTLSTAVTMLRAVSPTTLLLMLENSRGDITQNGLWKMNTDGTGLTQLSSDTQNGQSLCQFSQYAWSNVSRDGTMYALQEVDTAKNTYSMDFGSMNGGTPYQFAHIVGTQLFLVGWTSL